MDMQITIKLPIKIHHSIFEGMTVSDLKKLLTEKYGLKLPESCITDVDANYDVGDDTILHEHNRVEFRERKK